VPAGQNLDNSGYQEALARGLGGVATNAYSNAYGQERQNQQAAAGMIPAFSSFAAQQPYMGLQNYMAAISPALQFGNRPTPGRSRTSNRTTRTILLPRSALWPVVLVPLQE
jgi:hypothetical protein